MNGLLSMIGMQTELDYLIGDFPACFGDTPLAICEGEDEPTQLIFTTLYKARSKIPKDHYSKENGSREYYIKKIEIEQKWRNSYGN